MAQSPFSVSVYQGSNALKNNHITLLESTTTLRDVLSAMGYPETDLEKITVSRLSVDSSTSFGCDPDLTVGDCRLLDPEIRRISFFLKSHTVTVTPPATNAFNVLMTNSRNRYLPDKKDETFQTGKILLFNAVLDEMQNENVSFPRFIPDVDSKYVIQVLTNTLWYLDGCKLKILEASKRQENVVPIPERFIQNFNNFNNFKKKKLKAPSLSANDCKTHSEILFTILNKPYMANWGKFAQDVEKLAISLQSYSTYLTHSNIKQNERQCQSRPCRKLAENASVEHRPPVEVVREEFGKLDAVLKETILQEPVQFDENIHTVVPFQNRMQRHRFIESLRLSMPVDLIRYDPGGGIGNIIFLWRVQSDRTTDEILTSGARMLQQLKPKFPEYHTREMRSLFLRQYSSIGPVIAPHILRSIYSQLSLDFTTDRNPALDERLRLALMGEDPEIISDLRHLNTGRPGNTFKTFFEILGNKVEAITAADERRHGVAHFSEFISITDLREQTARDCPEDTAIPSETTILLSFMPKNTHSKTAKNYTGTIPLQHKVQSRQLRQTHPDAHYAAAVFRYMRGLAVKLRENTILLSVDDKSKVDIGEPGLPISSGVRGKKSIVPAGTILGSLDHDFHQKGSLTPSVCLNVDIPSDLRESFYRGQVSVILKDSIFMASSPFRHAAEIRLEVLRARKMDEENHRPERNILMLYSDGGPDHRLTYDSVKVSLIALFKSLDLDMLVAARTAPGHSWANPVERVMSILNLGYQNCAIDRTRCSDEIETLIKNCSGMESIRSQAAKHPQIRDAWATAVEPIIDTLNKRTERLCLKDKPFEVRSPATDDQIESINSFAGLIDPSLDMDHLQKKDTSKCEKFQKFLETHCRERNYSFQIKKCDQLTCCRRSSPELQLQWLPDPVPMETGDHYKQLEEVLGTETDESHRPSLRDDTKTIASEQQGCGASMLTAQRVRKSVDCSLCEKPRCIFSQRKLTDREHSGLKRLKNRYHYICGANITPEGDVLEGVVFVNLKITCESHVEFAYFSSKIGRQDICGHCGAVGAERDPGMAQRYRTVLPQCEACLAKGQDIIKRQPIIFSK